MSHDLTGLKALRRVEERERSCNSSSAPSNSALSVSCRDVRVNGNELKPLKTIN